MVAIINERVIFNEIPSGYPEPGKTTIIDRSEEIDVDVVELRGGILVKTIALSIDPYMRGCMRDAKIESYAPAFLLNKPLSNHGIAVVVRSEHDKYQKGSFIYGFLDFSKYNIIFESSILWTVPSNYGLSWTTMTSICGLVELCAYAAWKEYSKASEGETAFVSSGAGAVGSYVIQLAKRDGMKVIASAGSNQKVEFMKSIGADVAFNYKTTSTEDQLKKEGPIDVYWDNVGGETLDAALANAVLHARFIECGMISGYNEPTRTLKNAMQIFSRRISIQGIMTLDHVEKYADAFRKEVPQDVADGKIKYMEQVYQGLDSVGQAISDVQTGLNVGKAVILVTDP